MTLAQVQAAIALVVALIGTWAALLVAVALLFPGSTSRAERSLALRPWPCLGVGFGMLLITLIGAALLRAPNPGGKLLGLVVLTVPTVALMLGSAGVAKLLGARIADMSGARSPFGSLVRGSLVYALAAFFPGIGWYVFAPIATLCALGSGVMSLWPEPKPAAPPVVPPVVPPNGPEPAQA